MVQQRKPARCDTRLKNDVDKFDDFMIELFAVRPLGRYIALAIEVWMLRTGGKQRELAARLHVSEATLTGWKTERQKPTAKQFRDFVSLVDAPASEENKRLRIWILAHLRSALYEYLECYPEDQVEREPITVADLEGIVSNVLREIFDEEF